MKLRLLICFIVFGTTLSAQITRFEESNGQESSAYHEGIAWWQRFAVENDNVIISNFGETDAGHPLHLVCMSSNPVPIERLGKSGKTILLINNAIHPGEPDGVDASMLLFRDLKEKPQMAKLLESCVVVCIPYYNIGGALNRNSHSRANQEGPIEYGFRGNSQNLDLNRDFIKCDSKNALSFSKLLQQIDPDVYIETHVSNGADYQYTMTYLPTQPDKLGFGMGEFLRKKMIPSLEESMLKKNEAMCPYVNIHGGPLEDKIHAFYDMPRYSTGLTTLHQIFGFITETHMLKDFKERVWATHKFLKSALEFCSANSKAIKEKREQAKQAVAAASSFPLDWSVDTLRYKKLNFKGYEYTYKKSEVTGKDRLFYDRSKPITKKVSYYNRMNPKSLVSKPKYYILPRGYWEVSERLQANGVKLIELKQDSILNIKSYKVLDYETGKQPYEKHYIHSNIKYELESIPYPFHKGDYMISMGTDKDRFIMEVLEPNAPDSYFNWNFFDAVLQQKEWYSSYVFEDKAAGMLRNDKTLKEEFESKKKADAEFSNNPQAQLYWLYKQSPHYEKEHMRLPIFRVE